MSGSEITAAQTKAARALLGWSQTNLAKSASVAVSTVADFERGQRTPVPNNLDAMRGALTNAGISFPAGGAVVGQVQNLIVRSNVPSAELRPVRWVDETQLEQWAQRRDSQQYLPELVRRLVLATAGYAGDMRFPSGDSVSMHGWDGIYRTATANDPVPGGWSGWEMGVNQQPRRKADDDYANRLKNPGHLEPAETCFVFVTLRRWADKDSWVQSKRAERKWRDVRALDAVDIVQWLERVPAVGIWLAGMTGGLVPDVQLLPEVWREWSRLTKIPLSEDLILIDRDKEAARIHKWLNKEPSLLSIGAESTSEAIVFLFAAISRYPSDWRDYFGAKTIVVTDADVTRALSNVPTPLIIVTTEIDPGVAVRLVEKGHQVYMAFGSNVGAPDDVITLPRPNRYAIAEELQNLGMEKDKAVALARDSARSITVLRRLMPDVPGLEPAAWARPESASDVVTMLLVGAWDESREADQRVVEEVAGAGYASFVSQVTNLLAAQDSPVRKVGSVWKIASPRDAWFRLAPFVSTPQILRFEKVVRDVLAEADPRYQLPDKGRWMAELDGAMPEHSFLLRQGLTETIALLGVFGDRHPTISHLCDVSRRIVHDLLHDADAERWWSLSDHLRNLAEASPEGFLDAVAFSLDKNDPPIMSLFQEDDEGIFGRVHHPKLLWALEVLAWSPDYLARATECLVRLAERDPQGKWSNRPSHSLREIYSLWHPQTQAAFEDRLDVLSGLRQRFPQVIWELTLDLYPKTREVAHGTATPRWRDLVGAGPKPVTRVSIHRGASVLGQLLLDNIRADANRWCQIFERFSDFTPELRKDLIQRAIKLNAHLSDEGQRDKLRQAMRRIVNRHRLFSDTDWSLPEAELDELEKAYLLLEITDPVVKHAWLFDAEIPPILRPYGHDLDKNRRLSEEQQQNALKEVLSSFGFAGVEALALAAKHPPMVGAALAKITDNMMIYDAIAHLLNSSKEHARQAALGAAMKFGELNDQTAIDGLIDLCIDEGWSSKSMGSILAKFPTNDRLLARVKSIGGETEKHFWQEVSVFGLDALDMSVDEKVEILLSVNRAPEAAGFVARQHLADTESQTLKQILDGILAASPMISDDGGHGTTLKYYIEQIFLTLDKDETFSENDLAHLEWSYLELLEHSARPPKKLHRLLATSPSFFRDVVSAIYRSDRTEEIEGDEDHEAKVKIAGNASTLLGSWHELPGSTDDDIDGKALEDWVKESRVLCDKAGRGEIGDQKIGEVLAYAPADEDGVWPCVAVRDVIEICRSKDLEIGFDVGVWNKRGVTTRSPLDGGTLEREEASYYRKQAKAVRLKWPRTSAVLQRIAESYLAYAKEHDQDAERRQW